MGHYVCIHFADRKTEAWDSYVTDQACVGEWDRQIKTDWLWRGGDIVTCFHIISGQNSIILWLPPSEMQSSPEQADTFPAYMRQ